MGNPFTKRRLIESYKDTFLMPDGTLRASSRDIFKHLLGYSHFFDDSIKSDAISLARVAGRRDVVAKIMQMMNISEETMATYNSGGNNDGLV